MSDTPIQYLKFIGNVPFYVQEVEDTDPGHPYSPLNLYYSLDNQVWNTVGDSPTWVVESGEGCQIYFRGDGILQFRQEFMSGDEETKSGWGFFPSDMESNLQIKVEGDFYALLDYVSLEDESGDASYQYDALRSLFIGAPFYSIPPISAFSVGGNAFNATFLNTPLKTIGDIDIDDNLSSYGFFRTFSNCENLNIHTTPTNNGWRIFAAHAEEDAAKEMFLGTGDIPSTPYITTSYEEKDIYYLGRPSQAFKINIY